MAPVLPTIPETITVHLGRPDDASAPNVTLPFIDYIKNVASSEIYPTWPDNALRANIYAQISFALNRVYTEYYRSRGYDFDITSSTAFDQSFVNGREIFENISRLVDQLYDSYIVRQGAVEPLFAQYCDGDRVTCSGLSQWGTVSLAEQGYTPYRILTNYYGSDINIRTDVPVAGVRESAPLYPLRLGSSGEDVRVLQLRLNRIGENFPSIPKIAPIDGIFGVETQNAVREFQRAFSLASDGIVGRQTWYAVLRIFNSVKRLNELTSEGLTPEEVTPVFPELLRRGDEGRFVRALQYYLALAAYFLDSVPSPPINGIFDEATEQSVIAFQNTYGLTPDGIVGDVTFNTLYNAYRSFYEALPDSAFEQKARPFPGVILKLGAEGEDVQLLQTYLDRIADAYPQIPRISADGLYGPATAEAVRAFQRFAGLPDSGTVTETVWAAIADTYDSLASGE